MPHFSQRVRALRARSPHLPDLGSVGPWRLIRRLGSGPWSEVYLARPDRSSAHTADYVLKMVSPEHCEPERALAMLRREAYLGRQLNHPHVAAVLAAQVDQLPAYLVTPYVAGATLRDTLAFSERLPAPHALWVVRQVAEGISALHTHGWLHGDVKPDNIFVALNGHVTLIDFGLACPVRQGGVEPSFAGTPRYAAPEWYVRRSAVSTASDIYSLGATLFETLTGQLPFQASDEADLRRQHLTQPSPDPRRAVAGLSRRISALCRWMLAKEPVRRPTADELVTQLIELEIETLDERCSA